MADSVVRHLEREMACESLLECVHGLRALDEACFRELDAADGPRSVDEVAAAVDRERSTVYRSIQRLLEAGFVEQEQVNYDHGGYYHVYRAVDGDRIADDMQALLDDWYAKMGRLVDEFRGKYGGEADGVAVEG